LFLYGFNAGLFVVILAVIFYKLFLKEVLLENLPAIQSKIDQLALGNYFIIFAILLSTFNAAFEEYYWRWFAFRGLTMKLSWPLAVIISAIGFSLHHFVILTEFFAWPMVIFCGFMVFLGGIIMAWIYQKTNSIWGAFIFHFLIDMTVMGLVYILL
jgi:membrane protease YdiL (CAAX protease family)